MPLLSTATTSVDKIVQRTWLRCWMSVMALTTLYASVALAQERQLQPVVQGDLAPGMPQIYTVRAGAGDLIFGAFELRGTGDSLPVTVGLYDESGSMVKKEAFWGDPLPVGFVTPKNGTYQIRIAAKNAAGGSYTLRTERQTVAERMARATAVTPAVRFKSSRIDQLIKDVSAGQAGAVERFWSEAEAHGGPLIETIDGNDEYMLVTFLWKEIYDTHNVLVISPAEREDYMSHLPGTNVWYKTVRVFRGSRFSYKLVPNDLKEEHPSNDGWSSPTAQKDPLNPRFGDGGEASILETPGAPDESWYWRTPPARGTITKHHLDSVLLKGPRDVSVYTPPGYAPSNGPYALLILFDGSAYEALPATTADEALGLSIGAPSTLDNLIADHRIRPTVVCFVSDNRRNFNRNLEMRKPYAAAMATELVPWLRSSYAVSTDPKDVVLGGYSAGGGAASYVGLNYPDVFGNLLLQSGGGGIFPSLVIHSPKLPVRFYIDHGLYEDPWLSLPQEERGLQQVPAGDIPYLLYLLLAKGYDVTYRETAGAHEDVHWRATLAEGLIALLGQPAK